ncbi:unnamed protein product [Ectocarpus sp. 12 AP-2014]
MAAQESSAASGLRVSRATHHRRRGDPVGPHVVCLLLSFQARETAAKTSDSTALKRKGDVYRQRRTPGDGMYSTPCMRTPRWPQSPPGTDS